MDDLTPERRGRKSTRRNAPKATAAQNFRAAKAIGAPVNQSRPKTRKSPSPRQITISMSPSRSPTPGLRHRTPSVSASPSGREPTGKFTLNDSPIFRNPRDMTFREGVNRFTQKLNQPIFGHNRFGTALQYAKQAMPTKLGALKFSGGLSALGGLATVMDASTYADDLYQKMKVLADQEGGWMPAVKKLLTSSSKEYWKSLADTPSSKIEPQYLWQKQYADWLVKTGIINWDDSYASKHPLRGQYLIAMRKQRERELQKHVDELNKASTIERYRKEHQANQTRYGAIITKAIADQAISTLNALVHGNSAPSPATPTGRNDKPRLAWPSSVGGGMIIKKKKKKKKKKLNALQRLLLRLKK